MDKADKQAERDKKNAEKQAQLEAQVKTDYENKKKNGSGGQPIDQLKVWLDNAPFKSQDVALKRDTLFQIMGAVMAMKQKDVDTMCQDLSDKLILTLSKYLFKAFELIAAADKEVISIVQNGQHLIKVQLKIKEKMGNCCILKAQFEKHDVC